MVLSLVRSTETSLTSDKTRIKLKSYLHIVVTSQYKQTLCLEESTCQINIFCVSCYYVMMDDHTSLVHGSGEVFCSIREGENTNPWTSINCEEQT